ncbi:alanine--tRNA ligase [Bacteroidota bacterium]
MTANELRDSFYDFFKDKQHEIVESAPMVIKNDQSLMFTNAGMNQFKDLFLGNRPVKYKRIANSQKCLRVSGKHNDLEEVGHDTYHHTMFEMLGNWSFGDYFKQEAIDWAWEYLTGVLNIDKNRFYATVFEGDKNDNLDIDKEAYQYWLKHLPPERILLGTKKDNFWEMGNTGPCGPCSEIHIDMRPDEEIKSIPGYELINKDHPQVIEIWNLVFIQYSRKADQSLEMLPHKHIDTGMGFERLCRVIQGKTSNYDTDIFQAMIRKVEELSGLIYGNNEKNDIAMRVITDHVRAISFSIADGQLPTNAKAGYVIRRILRRAVRYGYTFLNFREPFINEIVPVLVEQMGHVYNELKKQQELIIKVITEEENSFLRTLDTGIKLLDQIVKECKKHKNSLISGYNVFILYDRYGFPPDLTELIARENKLDIDMNGFNEEMQKQKERARNAASIDTDDWIVLRNDLGLETEFIGYDSNVTEIQILRYRKLKVRKKELYQLVFNNSPFYAESGGQVGDTGYISNDSEKIRIIDTQKVDNLIVHIVENLPKNPEKFFLAEVDVEKRKLTASNHTATHLLHFALRKVLGNHVEQKGSLVHPDYLRFDFSHFQKLSKKELKEIEHMVNDMIRSNYFRDEFRNISINEAQKMGAMALFGEKYGDEVRVIKFGESIELCGGIHCPSTGEIGFFKIVSEEAISAGVRRIEAISSMKAEEFIDSQLEIIHEIKEILNVPDNLIDRIKKLKDEKKNLEKELEEYRKNKQQKVKLELKSKLRTINSINAIIQETDLDSAELIKDLAFQMKREVKNLFLLLGAKVENKALLTLMISENMVKEKNLNAAKIIREIAKEIKGGGGGQDFFATAGGKDVKGIAEALKKGEKLIEKL